MFSRNLCFQSKVNQFSFAIFGWKTNETDCSKPWEMNYSPWHRTKVFTSLRWCFWTDCKFPKFFHRIPAWRDQSLKSHTHTQTHTNTSWTVPHWRVCKNRNIKRQRLTLRTQNFVSKASLANRKACGQESTSQSSPGEVSQICITESRERRQPGRNVTFNVFNVMMRSYKIISTFWTFIFD